LKGSELNDTYKTLSAPTDEVIYKEKGSKFIGYAFPVCTEEEIAEIIQRIKKEHHKANHCCYAYKIGAGFEQHRVNDDGEPSHSAGMPIYGQIQSFGLSNVLVLVVRYFGGVKLGVGGLVIAYRTTAQMALDKEIEITFGYKDMNKVMKVVRDFNAEIKEQVMELNCKLVLSVRSSSFDQLFISLETLRIGEVK
jgi:uncharacterized YigZ family protein